MFEQLEKKLVTTTATKTVEPGVYLATVFGIVDIGNQVQKKYMSDETEEVDTIRVLFEFSTEVNEEGVPATTTVKIPIKRGDRSHLSILKNAAVDADGNKATTLVELVGKTLQLEMIQMKDGGYVCVDKKTFSKPMKGVTIPQVHHDPVLFGMTVTSKGTEADLEVFKTLKRHTLKEIMDTTKGQKLPAAFHEHYEAVEEEFKKRQKDFTDSKAKKTNPLA